MAPGHSVPADPPLALTLRRWVRGGLARLAVLLVALVVSLLGGEGLTRWIYRDVTTTADFRGYFTVKWMRAHARENRYGFRDREYSEAKPPGTYRVAVLGDSFTWGNGVREADRFTNILQDVLRSRHIEVLNFGYPGDNWTEHVKKLERRIFRLQPDYVLLQWGTNDIELDRDVKRRPRIPPLITDPEWHEALHHYSALYTVADAQWVRYQLSREMGASYDTYMRGLYADPNSEGAVHAATLMRRFVESCRRQHVPVGIVLFPTTDVDLGKDYPYRFLHERTLAICEAEGIPCIDLLPKFTIVKDRRTLWASPLDSHPGTKAHRIAAGEILATLARTWGVEESGAQRKR